MITSLGKITNAEGNKLIADLLGYEYVPHNDPSREPLVMNGYTLNHGYWRRKIRNMADLAKASNEGFQLVIHRPKLEFDEKWEDIIKVVSYIERLEDYETEFVINKTGVEVNSKSVNWTDVLRVKIAYPNNRSLDRLRVLWSCVVLWCKYHKAHQDAK